MRARRSEAQNILEKEILTEGTETFGILFLSSSNSWCTSVKRAPGTVIGLCLMHHRSEDKYHAKEILKTGTMYEML